VHRNPKHYLPFALTLVVIVLDRLTKVIVTTTMDLHESIPFLGNVVRWSYIQNDGMVFGAELLGVRPLGILSLLAVIVVTAILVRISDEPRGVRWILAAILGGAIGNTYDRLMYGYVIDFVDVDMPDFIMERFAVFNVADSAVSVGVTILLWMLLFKSSSDGRDSSSTESGFVENASGGDKSLPGEGAGVIPESGMSDERESQQ
jgi:signal peptidase II